MSKASPPPPPPSESQSPSEVAGSPGEGELVNPLAGAAPPDAPPAPPVEQKPDPEGTARIGAQLLHTGCAMFLDAPLTEIEAEAFERDLCLVLAKHDVPNLPYQEEVNLALTTGRIIVPRVLAKRAAAKEAEANGNRPVDRKEGQRQERPAEKAGVGSLAGASSSEAASLFS